MFGCYLCQLAPKVNRSMQALADVNYNSDKQHETCPWESSATCRYRHSSECFDTAKPIYARSKLEEHHEWSHCRCYTVNMGSCRVLKGKLVCEYSFKGSVLIDATRLKLTQAVKTGTTELHYVLDGAPYYTAFHGLRDRQNIAMSCCILQIYDRLKLQRLPFVPHTTTSV